MRHYEAPEHIKHWSGIDPSNPPQGEHWCTECGEWDDDCTCFSDETPPPTDQTPNDTGNHLWA